MKKPKTKTLSLQTETLKDLQLATVIGGGGPSIIPTLQYDNCTAVRK